MEILLIFLVFVFGLAKGSSLWSLPHLADKELNFNVEHDLDSVQVQAFIKDASLTTGIRFFLFTRHLHQGIELQVNDNKTLLESGFDHRAGLKVLIHGFANSASSTFSTSVRNAYLKFGKASVIVVDWSALCLPPFYSSAVDNAIQVGEATAALVVWLMSRGLPPSQVHILGHSVGAHIAGISGRSITARGQGQVGRITGLDPAKPMFEYEAASFRLSLHDAVLVDCVHTCGGFLGLSDATCHADFYPNGGTSPQPGCQFDFFGVCSHQRAYKYYVESISRPRAFKALVCSAMGRYSPADCGSGSSTVMGEHMDVRTRGIFYFATSSKPPFSLGNSSIPVGVLKKFSWYFL